MALDVTVNITVSQSKGTASYGVPLIAAAGQDAAIPYTECKKLSEVTDAGFSADSDVYKAAELLCKQSNRPKTFAVYGAATLGEDTSWLYEDWRQLIITNYAETDTDDDGNDYSSPLGVATVIENLADGEVYKYFFTSYSTGDSFVLAAWAEYINQFAELDRTAVMYYTDDVQCPEAALVGATAGYKAGSFTYKNIILTGVAALKLTDKEIKAVNGGTTLDGTEITGCGLTIVEKAGDIVTTEGKAASGEYIDVIDSKDWIIENIAYDCQKLFNTNPKIPYTSVGITQIENTVLSVLKTAFTNGMIAPTADNSEVGDYSTDFTEVSDVSDTDKASRYYGGGAFTFTLAGAIHEAEINGEIVI